VFTTEDDDGNTIYSKAFEVLQQLAITYGARVYQSNGRWVFEQYVNRSNAARYVTTYDNTMTRLATFSVSDDVDIDQTSGGARLTGGQFNYLPAVGSVSVEYVQEKFSSTSKPITFRSTAPTKTLGIIGASTSTQLKFYGPHNYNITSSTSATTNDGTIAVVWRMQIRIESATTPGLYYYFNRAFNGFAASAVYGNASWSTTPGYYYYHGVFGKVIFGALSLNAAPVVLTANLPTSGTLRVTSEHYANYNPIDGTAYTLAAHQTDTWSTTLTIARMDDAKDDASSVIYRVENNNANVDSNIELNLGTTRIANGLFQTGDLSVYNGTSWVSGLAFRRGSSGLGDQILNLLISEMLGLHASPIQRFNGQMFNDASFDKRLAFDSARYLNIGGTFSANFDQFDGEWFLIDYDPASVGTLDAERQPVAGLVSGGSNVGNYDGVIEVGRIAGMSVDATQEKIGPFEQTASGGKIGGTLDVTGNAVFDANVQVDGDTTIVGTIDVTDLEVSNDLSVTGSSTLGGLSAGTTTLGASTISSASVTGNTSVGGTLGVTGTSTLGTLNAGTSTLGASTLSSASVTGNTSVGGTLGVTGTATLGTLNATATSVTTLAASSNTTIGGTLGVTGKSTLGTLEAGTSTLGASTLSSASVTGNQTIGGTLGVTGTSTLGTLNAGTSTLGSASVTGNTSVGGTLGVTGTATLGTLNAAATSVTTLAASSNTTIGGTLGVTGTSTLGTLNAAATSVSTLAASSNATIGGTLGVTGKSTLGTLEAGTSTLGASTLGSAVVTGETELIGATRIVESLQVDRAASFTQGVNVGGGEGIVTNGLVFGLDVNAFLMNVIGPSKIDGTLNVAAAATIGSELNVGGTSRLADITATDASLSTLETSGAATIGQTLDVVGRTSTQYVQLDTDFVPNGEPAGAFYWDPDGGIAAVRGIDGVSLDLNEKEIWFVKNQSGSSIAAGSAVYAAGTLGASGQLLIAKMIANGTINAKYYLGITQSTIANGADGYVVRVGKIKGLNTTAWNDGDVLYVDETTAGALSDTEPTAPNLKLPTAFVVHSAANGTIAVRQTAGTYLYESHDVQIASATTNEVLARTSSGRWENKTIDSLLSTSDQTPTETDQSSFSKVYGGSGTMMGDPEIWMPITIGGVDYLIPLYLAP
jgi:hypothetical protein